MGKKKDTWKKIKADMAKGGSALEFEKRLKEINRAKKGYRAARARGLLGPEKA